MLPATKRRIEVSQALFSPKFTTGLHQFLNLALIVVHDGLKAARFQNDTAPEQDNVAAASQERNAVGDKDPSFCRKQSAGADDVICEGFIIQVTLAGTWNHLTVNMTRNVGINSGQHIIQQYQVCTSIDGAGKCDTSSLATTQLWDTSATFWGPKRATHRNTLLSYFRHVSVRKEGQVRPECTGCRPGVSKGTAFVSGDTHRRGQGYRTYRHIDERTKYYP